MDFISFLLKYGFKREELNEFGNSLILRPQLDEKNNILYLPISANEPITFTLYQKVCKAISEKEKCKVRLLVKPRSFITDVKNLKLYISEFERLNPMKKLGGLYPQQSINGNVLVIPEGVSISQNILNDLKSYLLSVGIQTKTAETEDNNDRYESRTQIVRHAGRKIPEGATKVRIKDVSDVVEDIIIEGEIYAIDSRLSKKEKLIQTFKIHEGVDAMTIIAFEGKRFNREQLNSYKVGDQIKVFGSSQFAQYGSNKGNIEFVAATIEKGTPKEKRKDNASKKRIELHVHTNKSEMDGISEPKAYINTAFDFGMDAIAITDHSVVQAYPEAQETLYAIEKKNPTTPFKVIFGVELHVVDDVAKIINFPSDIKLGHKEFCVFDLETTGLSNEYDEIFEFGAVKIKDGFEIDRMHTFIKPKEKLKPFTMTFSNVTQEMVDNAPTLDEALPKIMEFIGDSVLVAHNGYFDYGFLESAARTLNIDFKKPMVDTLPLSRALIPERTVYRLGNIARNYKIEYNEDEAHRADYDASVLAQVFMAILNELPNWQEMTLNDLNNVQTDQIYKKNHPYHMNLLAKDLQGIKDIYDLVTLSHTKYLTGSAKDDSEKKSSMIPEARIIRSEVEKYRSHCLVGAGCANSELFEVACNRSQQELEEVMSFYDYVEVQPPQAYSLIIDESSSFNYERLLVVLKRIIDTAKKLNIPVVATSDCHYLNPEDKIFRDIIIYAKRIGGARHPSYYARVRKTDCPESYLMTTDEMLEAFSFLDEQLRNEIVIDNTHLIADKIEKMHPVLTDIHTPHIDGCDEILKDVAYNHAKEIYGDPLPEIVSERLKRELESVVGHGFAVQYYIAHLLVKQSHENGYIVGSRGSVGSSFLATMAGITEVNPLVPHYICPSCKHNEFFINNEYADGFDMPDKVCPKCGTKLIKQGHNIPFETFLGFYGDKVPDIDLNFSGEYQNKAQLQIKDIFGENNVFAAGTIETIKSKKAIGYIHAYEEERRLIPYTHDTLIYLASKLEGIKVTTGQHPGGIVVCPKENEIHDFTPLQYSANNADSDWKTTHFAIKDLHDTILKLDILGHVDPTAIKMLGDISGIDPRSVPLHDEKVLSLFNSTDALEIVNPDIPYVEINGAVGLPEFGTRTSRDVLIETNPTSFADLVRIEGLTHGTNVWRNNLRDLVLNGTCTIETVIGCRDDIMTYLISMGLDEKESFDIMEKVRKGKGLIPEWEEDMRAHNVPEWYIYACKKIEYMFPKAHAVAYCMMALRIAWFKVYHPEYYYAVFFSVRADAYEIDTMIKGEDAILSRLNELRPRLDAFGKDALSVKEKNIFDVLEVAYEMYRRGYRFSNIDIKRSAANRFTVDKDNHKVIIPPFTAIDGLGDSVGSSVERARNESEFLSIEDLSNRTQLSKTHIQILERMGVLKDLPESNQLTLF